MMQKYIPIRSLSLFLALFGFLLIPALLKAEDSLQIVKITVPQLSGIYLDRFSDLYVTTKDNVILKFNKNGIQQFSYKENKYGEAGIIVLNNPLNILVSYPNSNVVSILDRNLTVSNEIKLIDSDVSNIAAIGLATDNTIWIYDDVKIRLVKMDFTGKLIRKSNVLTGLIGNHKLSGQIWEQDKFLFIRVPGLGWLQFDDFANFIQILPLPDHDILRLEDDKIWYLENGEIIQFDLSTLRKKIYPIPGMIGKYNLIDQKPGLWVKSEGDEIHMYKL